MPVKRLYTYFTYRALNVECMREAARYLEGEHDFKSFCQAGAQVESTVRTVYSVEVEELGPELILRICGSGFLYNMVRIISGTLIRVGLHVWQPEYVKTILEAKDRTQAGETVPAKGLFLKEIVYL